MDRHNIALTAAARLTRSYEDIVTLGDTENIYEGADLSVLGAFARARKHIDSQIDIIMWDLADQHTWQEIGDALGISRQAAQQRYGR